nr:hypothetical protein [Corynebacterium auriscanis]
MQAGSSVRAAAVSVGLPHSVAYRLARQLDVEVRRYRVTEGSERISQLWVAGWALMDIARQCKVNSSVVYRIGIELGLWKRNPHGRRAAATTRRCGYLQLRVNASGRKDAASVCGINQRDALDIDKNLIKLGRQRVAFEPDWPATAQRAGARCKPRPARQGWARNHGPGSGRTLLVK